MTTATATLSNRTLAAERTSRPSLEEPVERLMAALFREEPETAAPTAAQSAARRVHEARQLRQAGDLEGALEVFAGVDTAKEAAKEARWAYAGWLDLAKRHFGDRSVMVYTQGTGRAAALTSRDDGAMEVAAARGCAGSRARWSPGGARGA